MKTPCSIPDCGRPVVARGYCSKHYQRFRKSGDPLTVKIIFGDDVGRFWSKVEKTDQCWLWRGPINQFGYGHVRFGGKDQFPHRIAYTLTIGPIPVGLQLDHLCRVRNCVNPAHLEPVTPRENNLRSMAVSGVNARKTHCHKGHPFDAENTRINGKGARCCRACNRELWRQRRAS